MAMSPPEATRTPRVPSATGELPLCPECFDEDTASTGASAQHRYRYICKNVLCQYEWYQTRPDIMKEYMPANVKPAGSRSSSLGGYKCNKCGQLKKDHICSMQTPSPGPSKKIKKAAKNKCGKCGLIKRGHICAAKINVKSLESLLDNDTERESHNDILFELGNIDSSFVPIQGNTSSSPATTCEICHSLQMDDHEMCLICNIAFVHKSCKTNEACRDFVCVSCFAQC